MVILVWTYNTKHSLEALMNPGFILHFVKNCWDSFESKNTYGNCLRKVVNF